MTTNKFFWLNPNLEVREGGIGKGTFAKKKVKKGDLLLVLSGYVMNLKEEQNLPGTLSDNGIQVSENFSIGVTSKKELGGINYFNHSCEPNAGIKGQIFLVAMKDIEQDTEVTFDYAMTLSRAKGVKSYKMKCSCGAKKCRGFITDTDWTNQSLQRKYKGFFQFYIQEKIDRLKKHA